MRILGVKVLPNSLKISNLTNVDIFQLNLAYINRKLGLKSFATSSSSVWETWTRLPATGVLKQEFTNIKVTTYVGVNNFRNI